MSNKISWTNETWNPIIGCSHASPGCDHCYAERMAARMTRNPKAPHEYQWVVTDGHWNGTTALVESSLEKPLHWRAPRLVFVGSMTDLFHPATPDEWIDRVFAVMAICPRHTFQILTKRPERMREYLTSPGRKTILAHGVDDIARDAGAHCGLRFPFPNVWLGVTAEDQQRADERIPILLDTPAALRFVSVEPCLGAVSLKTVTVEAPAGYQSDWIDALRGFRGTGGVVHSETGKLDWVICGGETGPGARPMHPLWARVLRGQCKNAGVPFHFKSWGEWVSIGTASGEWPTNSGKAIRMNPAGEPEDYGMAFQRVGTRASGRLLDGELHDAIPEVGK